MAHMTGPLLKAMAKGTGAPARGRADALAMILSSIKQAMEREAMVQDDPVRRTRQELLSDQARLEALEQEVAQEVEQAVESALALADATVEDSQ
jgi:hypothetical protein